METKPSKTARKRESQALQALGERLIGLPQDRLAAVPLDETLRDAVLEARRIRSHGALRRQRQRIGKLMRDTDAGPIRAALAALDARDARETRLLHRAEAWRDRLFAEGTGALREYRALTGGRDAALEQSLDAVSRGTTAALERRHRRDVFRRVHAALRTANGDNSE